MNQCTTAEPKQQQSDEDDDYDSGGEDDGHNDRCTLIKNSNVIMLNVFKNRNSKNSFISFIVHMPTV